MSLRLRRTVLLVATSVLALTSAARAENWPEWRGPTRDGICTETSVPTTWSRTENVLWRTPLPGRASFLEGPYPSCLVVMLVPLPLVVRTGRILGLSATWFPVMPATGLA